jgi:hypothetical protein
MKGQLKKSGDLGGPADWGGARSGFAADGASIC